MKCKNCDHKIEFYEGKWDHSNEELTLPSFNKMCGAKITSKKKLEKFRERWLKKYGKKYRGKKSIICGCKNPEK